MFKKYDQKQQFLLPISLEDFIAEDHISRILNDIIDAIDITTLEAKYSKDVKMPMHLIKKSIKSSKKASKSTKQKMRIMVIRHHIRCQKN